MNIKAGRMFSDDTSVDTGFQFQIAFVFRDQVIMKRCQMVDSGRYCGYWLVLIMGLLGTITGYAQVQGVVLVGQLYGLGVIANPGDVYTWHVYKDYTLTTEADSTEVVFPSTNTGANVPVIWMKEGLWYFTVVVINDEGCSNLKVGLILVKGILKQTATISISVDQNPVCAGMPDLFTAKTLNQGSIPVFRWMKNGVQVGLNKPFYLDSTLVDGDLIKCILRPSLVLKSGEPEYVESNEIRVSVITTVANFTFTEASSKVPGEVRMINKSTGADEYIWDFGNGQTSNEENPLVTILDDGVYLISLTARNFHECTDTMAVRYRMMFKGLYVPNAFAPTASTELPGVFKPAGTNLKNYLVEIYDNWGHLLWRSDALDENGSPAESWDGKVDGALMPQDTYIWKIRAEFLDGTIWTGSDIGKGTGRTIGTVTLLR